MKCVWAWCLVTCLGAQASFAQSDAKATTGDDTALEWAWWYVTEASEAMLADKRNVKPQPVNVEWRGTRLGALSNVDVVLDLTSFDFNGDGVDSIVLLTPDEVLLLENNASLVSIASRAAWPGPSSNTRSRIAVGYFVQTREGLWAKSSEKEAPIEIHVEDGALRLSKRESDPLLCGALRLEQRQGIHHFSLSTSTWLGDAMFESSQDVLGVRCSDRDRDPKGRERKLFAAVDLRGEFMMGCRIGVEGCDLSAMDWGPLGKVGYAFSLGDLDRDGWPEIATTKATLPELRDRVSVWTTTKGVLKRVHSRAFDKGVAALTMVDIDGDRQLEVVAFVRAKQGFELWAINQ